MQTGMLHRIIKYCYLICLLVVAGCGDYNAICKSPDYEFKYEAAKGYYAQGDYRKASELFGSLLVAMKGTVYGEECLYMLGLSNFMTKDYESAASFFRKYYQSYPKGQYVELARYYSGYSLYKQTPEIRLDQTCTQDAIQEFNNFLEFYPSTVLKDQTMDMIYTLQDKLVEKEYLSAKLYYDLGTYVLNCSYGGNNYEACIITAQNALKDFPYASAERREELGIMILRAKYHLARQSVDEKRVERYRDAVDEYYAFVNDYPESKYMAEAKDMFDSANRIIKRKKINIAEEE